MAGASYRSRASAEEDAREEDAQRRKAYANIAQVLKCTLCASVQGPLPSIYSNDTGHHYR